MNRVFTLLILSLSTLWAQIPAGYYNTAAGLYGEELQQSLHDIIDGHQEQSYSSLHTHYQSTDPRPDGTVWDMYSDIPDGTPPYTYHFISGDQCGNYGGEGDCYNREHSWPKSWFNDQTPMYTDLFHVVPTDGYVNGQRSNWPYGEVNNPSWISLNGSRLGPCSTPGYSGTAFEPIDAYKGDFARIYFYMSTRYLNEDANWSGSPMTNGAQLEAWALDMMLNWHAMDPVSDKEIDRNNAVYVIQHNRNPFVDHPEFAVAIWSDAPPVPAAPSDLTANNITESSLDLSWTDNASDENGFNLYRDGSLILTLPENCTSTSVTGLQVATTYAFSLTAYSEAGESAATGITTSTLGGQGGTVQHFFEDFESMSGSTYLEGDYQFPSGVWNLYQAGNFSLVLAHSGSSCIAINDDKPDAHITTPAVNTLGSISFYYYQRNGSESDVFEIQRSVNGSAFETLATQSYNVGETYTLFSLNLADSSESVRIKILNDNQTGHLIIDDLTVTAYIPVGLEAKPAPLPERLQITGSFPNPFNPTIQLTYMVPQQTRNLSLRIFNLAGDLVAIPAQGSFSAGSHQLVWTGTNSVGLPQASGIYIVQLTDGSHTDIQRITLLR